LQRFDLINAVDTLTALGRAGLTVAAIAQGGGLVALAAATLAVTVLNTAAKSVLTFRAGRPLQVSPAHVSRRALREIFGYSVWSLIGTATRITRTQLGPLLIGSLLAVALITPYAVAARLVAYTVALLVAATGVLTPFATALHAEEDQARQQQLLTTGGRYCAALTLFLSTLLLLLGRPLIVLWTGPGLLPAVPLLMVMIVGELLPSTQYATRSMILAAARHRVLAWLGVVEVVCVVVLTVALARPLGVLGVSIGLVLPGVFLRGVAVVVVGCRLTGLPLRRYTVSVVGPVIACSVPPALVLGAAVLWHEPASWPQLILYAGGYGLLYLAGCVLLLGERRGAKDRERNPWHDEYTPEHLGRHAGLPRRRHHPAHG
jgi:O-antigen/teichoic acid export membrane protein